MKTGEKTVMVVSKSTGLATYRVVQNDQLLIENTIDELASEVCDDSDVLWFTTFCKQIGFAKNMLESYANSKGVCVKWIKN
jgi:hypothetical protein